ncbi:biotin-independent malonate decarboxylase subunit beta [Frondihabitans sucicola]|uniref:Biotin-independent malonate decarboxylase subunit beta n=1 Tax=Frondihabitans sucicola TaxID=1268041 RepID=A0ABM8GJJ7_9MICO|nr:biotin-independent malonate decarboxylase subunit beta [Frondihabitans sucicola]BDZ48560.1 biotin-independent malonate decarboxylase subunit beta [Frondihabitans sucicola]
MTTETDVEPLVPESAYVRRDSFIERDARSRAFALVDEGSGRELVDPFDRLESPWLQQQGVVPEADDGVVIVKGTVAGKATVVIGIEQGFQGGGIGEVSGAKIAAALGLATRDSRAGTPTSAVLLLETGGVRLQEANLGLAAVAEACSGVLELRALQPVVAVIAGGLGSFGGMSIVAGLCSTVVMTREARLGLNGPEVIESEGGIAEFDSGDHALVWSIDGGVQRHALGQADVLVTDDTAEILDAVRQAVSGKAASVLASRDLARLRAHLAVIDPGSPPSPANLPDLFATATGPRGSNRPQAVAESSGRGSAWMTSLADTVPTAVESTVIEATIGIDGVSAILLAVVPDAGSPYRRARHGEVGLLEGLVLAERVAAVVAEDADLEVNRKRPIVAVVDFPSQAYGRLEEMVGIHLHLAAAADAYATARTQGHPVVALVVGTALSGGFLAHGLQANQILALDDPAVEIHAMHKPAAARITRRTVAELDELATRIPPLSYDVRDWATLGLCNGLLPVVDADHPTGDEVALVNKQIGAAVRRARAGDRGLSGRWSVETSGRNRAATRQVWEAMTQQWR